MVTLCVAGMTFVFLIAVLIGRVHLKYREINRIYGKPYKSAIITIFSRHPDIKSGTTSIAFHPNQAVSFDKKVFSLAQIQLVQVIDGQNFKAYPDFIANEKAKRKQGRQDEQVARDDSRFLVITVKDEHGINKIAFTANKGFDGIATELSRVWTKFNLGL